MITAWRLLPKKRQAEAFTGEGARIAAGRWNSRGTGAVYLSATISLAALETLEHAGRAAAAIPYSLIRVDFPDEVVVETLALERLPANWRGQPPPESTRRIGSEWIARGTAVALRVPSVIVPEEWNLLLNPAHPDFRRLIIARPQTFRF
jgi:RES domain-containing protein